MDIDKAANKCVGWCCGRSLSSGDAVSPVFNIDLPEAMKLRASGMASKNQHKIHSSESMRKIK